MPEGERRNLLAARTKVRIIADTQGAGLLLYGAGKGTFDLAFAPSLDDDHFQTDLAHRGFRLVNVVLHEPWIVGIHKERNPSDCRENLAQELQPLGYKLDTEMCDAGHVSSWTADAGHETRPN